jgi:hypothetical protein
VGEIQRWTFDGPPAYEYGEGGWVTYADHVAAVATVQADMRDENKRNYDMGYEQGQRDAIAKAVAAVEGLATERELRSPSAIYVDLRDVTDRIKAVGGE